MKEKQVDSVARLDNPALQLSSTAQLYVYSPTRQPSSKAASSTSQGHPGSTAQLCSQLDSPAQSVCVGESCRSSWATSRRAEPSRAEPSRVEPSRVESSRAESSAESSRAEPSRAEPSRTEPSRAEPSRAEPSRAESNRAESRRVESRRAEPRRAESSRAPNRVVLSWQPAASCRHPGASWPHEYGWGGSARRGTPGGAAQHAFRL